MAFKPWSTIYLCNVPIDNTYQNQIFFGDSLAQYEYFCSKIGKTFSNYSVVRKNKNGKLASSVKVGCNIDELYAYNYMFYQNADHGNKWFYCFITNLVYINENTTEIEFETDVYQSWLDEAKIMDSFVEREHSTTDGVGDNRVPESFNIVDMQNEMALSFTTLAPWGYLIASTNPFESEDVVPSRGRKHSGIYQGLYFYYFTDISSMNLFLDEIEGSHSECIVFIALIPSFCVSNADIVDISEDLGGGGGYVGGTSEPAEKNFTIKEKTIKSFIYGEKTYTPKNAKMWTFPFFRLNITNHSGDNADYMIEDFADGIKFRMYGDISANPSVTLFPMNYKGIVQNLDCGISINNFPQCSFNSDTFKLWLAKNQFAIAADTIGGVAQLIGGISATAAGAGGVGVTTAASGASQIFGTINKVYQMSKEPNKSHSGSPKNNLLTAISKNDYEANWQYPKYDEAVAIDNFFTMYGYQTNKVKKPNMSSRPYFNYVKTIGVNITGNIPCDDLQVLKRMFDSGVTFWKAGATVGDYSVNNKPN